MVAWSNSLPLSISFIDLKNAFGSVAHSYIYDMLNYLHPPKEIVLYVKSLYSSLSAHIATKDWNTSPFPIRRGVLQGDTLSPLLFLICFNPIIQSIAVHQCNGCSLVLQKSDENCPSLPKQNSFIYALWNEKTSSEKIGWYLAKVLSIDDNGNATLRYKSGNNIEEVSLLSIDWSHGKGNGKWFLPPNTLSIPSKLSSSTHSKPRKVKGYADDILL